MLTSFRPSLPKLLPQPVSNTSYSYWQTPDFFLHATRSPLTQIVLGLELSLQALEQKPNTNPARQYLFQARLGADRIKQALEWLTLPHKNRRCAVAKVLCQLKQFYDCQSQSNTEVHFLINIPPSVFVTGSPFLLAEVITCLITNGLEAQTAKQKKVTVIAFQYRTQVTIMVIDNSQTKVSWLHKILAWNGNSTKHHQPGLGLRFVRESITQRMKGSIEWNSLPAGGSIFTIQLPSRIAKRSQNP